MLAETQIQASASRPLPLWRPNRTHYQRANSWLQFRVSRARAKDPIRQDVQQEEAALPRSPTAFAAKERHTIVSTTLFFALQIISLMAFINIILF